MHLISININPTPGHASCVTSRPLAHKRPSPASTLKPPLPLAPLPQAISPQMIDYPPPTVTGVEPSTLPGEGNVPITITGSNFGQAGAATVAINGRDCVVLTQNHNTINCQAPGGEPGDAPMVVTVMGQVSNPFIELYTGDVNPPKILDNTPLTGPTAGGTMVTITGQNFGPQRGRVTIGENPCTIQTWSPTFVTCLSPPGVGGDNPVSLVVAGKGYSTRSGLAFSYGQPIVSVVDPPRAPMAGNVPIVIQVNNPFTVVYPWSWGCG
jgi:hypothetical protein